MVTWETVCALVADLPGTHLDPPDRDNPAWRFRGHVLVRRNPSLRIPDEEEARRRNGDLVAIRVDRATRDALMRAQPATFFITPHWLTSPSVLVWLERADIEPVQELLTAAWLARAPHRLVREWERRDRPAAGPALPPGRAG